MVTSVSSSGTTALYYNLNNMTKTASATTCSNTSGEIEDSISYTGRLDSVYKSKEELWGRGALDGIGTLNEYVEARQHTANSQGLKSSDYETEYQEYMKSRGCDSLEELQALNSVPCQTKDMLLNTAEFSIKGISGSLEYSSGISISDEQVSSIVSNASLKNLATYLSTNSTSVSESASKLQTLISNTCKQNDIDDDLKSSLSSLLKNISDASDSINKWSEQVKAENEKNAPSMAKYNSNLIASYQD